MCYMLIIASYYFDFGKPFEVDSKVLVLLDNIDVVYVIQI